MAFFRMNIYSRALGMGTWVEALVPNPPVPGFENPLWREKMPALYLLHGLEGDETSWMRLTSLEREARRHSLCVILPSCGRSFYTDQPNQQKYFTYITKELPEIMESLLPISKEGRDRFIGGMSMGGYGAVKAALTFPDRYAACFSLSGVLDAASAAVLSEPEWTGLFGPRKCFHGGENDLNALARRVPADRSPDICLALGTEDLLAPMNRRFYEAFREKLPLEWREGPGGHDWDYWDRQIPMMLSWIADRAR